MVVEEIAGLERVVWVNGLTAGLDFLDDALFVDQKGYPLREADQGDQYAICAADGPLGVAEYWVGKTERVGKGLVFRGTIDADADHLRAGLLKFGDISLIRLKLFGSPRGESLDVEGQHDVLAAEEITQLDGVAVLVGQRKVWGTRTHLR